MYTYISVWLGLFNFRQYQSISIYQYKKIHVFNIKTHMIYIMYMSNSWNLMKTKQTTEPSASNIKHSVLLPFYLLASQQPMKSDRRSGGKNKNKQKKKHKCTVNTLMIVIKVVNNPDASRPTGGGRQSS